MEGTPLGLFTDLYQLTMAQGYWMAGIADRRSVFHLFYRRGPFGARAAIACGLDSAINVVERLEFSQHDLDYLARLEGADRRPLFQTEFLRFLGQLRWSGNLMAVPEGTCVFPKEPILRTDARLVEAQLLETALLNVVNFQTLVATKAARIRLAAGSTSVLEFGLRRAQGYDGGMSASRAAYIGGCDATSNVMAGQRYGIPVKGTHAHSWVMCFENEQEAFRQYARAMPGNVVLLVDTYDTVQGIENAIRIGIELRKQGQRLLGVRLDSGDLDALSRVARRRLDEAGLGDAQVVVSGDLDEYRMRELRQAQAPIDVWGVGTRLVTAYDEPALGGVYKLGAIADADGTLQYRLKLSNDLAKVTDPGVLQVRRMVAQNRWLGDVVYDEGDGAPPPPAIESHAETQSSTSDLLQPVFIDGKQVAKRASIQEARELAAIERQRYADWLWPDAQTPAPKVEWASPLRERKIAIMTELGGSSK